MSVTHVCGIDPGLVHTGVVHMAFNSVTRVIKVRPTVIEGTNLDDVVAVLWPDMRIFVEDYRTRSAFNTDAKMRAFVFELKQALPRRAVFLDNMGVKQVVRQPLMDLLGVWKFSTPTHHQDLRSAARIALFGMLKDDELNSLLADVVRDHLNGKDWTHV